MTVARAPYADQRPDARAGAGDTAATSLPAATPLDRAAVLRVFERARCRDRGVLLETEGMALLDAIGIATPRRIELPDATAAERLDDPPLPGERLVLKVVAPQLLHKTEAGGVRVIECRREAVVTAARDMARRFAGPSLAGFVLYEFVPHEPSFGHEFLLGMRWTRDFGPIVTLGPGGIHAEFLARAFRDGEGLAFASPAIERSAAVDRALERLVPALLATRGQRGRPPELSRAELAGAMRRFLSLAEAFSPDPIAEFEVNPLVVSGGRLVALDALLVLSRAPEEPAPPRPLAKMPRLLEPRSIAVVGVSEKLNPGRIILQNILAEGFPPERVLVVKPNLEHIDGCRCVPTLADLPGTMDLIVLSVSAAQSAEMLAEIADRRHAESVVLIPGGLEEKPGTEDLVARMRGSLARARAADWGGPLVNGGNCLGIRSVPGRYNTLFIPDYKLPVPRGEASPVALVTGSGAFAVSKTNKLAGVNPRYTITVGNQMDLTIADYLEVLEGDPAVEVFAVYVEGFRPLDGARFLRAVESIARGGRTVILYRAGRTEAGAAAAASHTAAVAGDHLVTRRLAEAAGALVADSLDDFEDFVRLSSFLRGRDPTGLQLGAVSNAGFECVAIGDSLGPFRLAPFTDATQARLGAVLERARLREIVSVRNPIDLTPMLGDADYEAVVRVLLEDPGVQAAVVGCVPMTGALNTLPAGPGHPDDLRRADGIVPRLIRLRAEPSKPWIAVVDAGRIYDPMAHALEDGGVPTYRTADRALRLFGRWCEHRLAAADASSGLGEPA